MDDEERRVKLPTVVARLGRHFFFVSDDVMDTSINRAFLTPLSSLFSLSLSNWMD